MNLFGSLFDHRRTNSSSVQSAATTRQVAAMKIAAPPEARRCVVKAPTEFGRRSRAMRMIKTILAGAAGFAAVAAAAPAAAQYGYSPYSGYSAYGYANPYGYSAYGGVNTSVAAQQCTAAVQNRLYNRGSIGGIIGALLGANTMNNSRVVGVTRVTANNGYVRVRGIASSG